MVAIDAKFYSLITDLLAQAATAAGADLVGSRREWAIPAALTDGLADHVAVGEAFSRLGLSQQTVAALTGGGSVGDRMAIRVQVDYLSAAERAFRLRHMSTVRCRTHAAGRRYGHATPGVGPIARVGVYAQDLIIAGAK